MLCHPLPLLSSPPTNSPALPSPYPDPAAPPSGSVAFPVGSIVQCLAQNGSLGDAFLTMSNAASGQVWGQRCWVLKYMYM